MVYDSARRKVVLVGGWADNNSYADTWEWDGNSWTERTTANAPPARGGHAMAYDSARQRVVLYGGWQDGEGYATDTWDWDGDSWTMRAPSGSGPYVANAAAAYDCARQKVVVFGIADIVKCNIKTVATWEWDGTAWSERHRSDDGPEKRAGFAMVGM